MLLAALALGLVMGAVVGGLGGGGGVLTVPALVFALGQSAQDATTGSVIIVGITAAVGALDRLRSGGVDWRTGIALGAVGIPAAYLGTMLNRHVDPTVLLGAFAALTLVAAAAMLFDARTVQSSTDLAPGPAAAAGGTMTVTDTRRQQLGATIATIVGTGTAVGFLTGFLGVGGGFLLVPALVIVLRMPIALAAGTSLLVIVLNSISSVAARLGDLHLDWHVIAPFTLAAVVGTVAGKRIADRFSSAALAYAFAGMLIAVGIFVGVRSVVGI